MWAIYSLTIRRLREPATIILFLLGCLLAWGLSGSDAFELAEVSSDVLNKASGNSVLLGTVLLCAMGLLVTVFTAASEIPTDISTRMIAILLSKPISRLQYISGKFVGSLAIGIVNTGLWITLMLICRFVFHQDTKLVSSLGSFVLTQYSCLLLLVPIAAIAICFSICFSDVISMILTVTYVMICCAISIVPFIAALSGPVIGKIVLTGYLFFPNIYFYLQGHEGLWGHLAIVTYTGSAAMIFLLVGNNRFRSGDLF